MSEVRASENKQEVVETLLQREEVLCKIEKLHGFTSVTSHELTFLNPGRRFKEIWLIKISDGERTEELVVKFYKRNSPKRWNREIRPRTIPSIAEHGPAFIAAESNNSKSATNHRFIKGDYLVFIEEYVQGKTLLELAEEEPDDALIYAEIAETKYRVLAELMRAEIGRVLSNVNPSNIVFPSSGRDEPKVVDWGGQTERDDPQWYEKLIDQRILAPVMR